MTEVIAGMLAPTGNGGLLVKQARQKAVDVLAPFKEHNTYGAAVAVVENTFTTKGFSAAMTRARSIAEAYEEVYLRELLGAS